MSYQGQSDTILVPSPWLETCYDKLTNISTTSNCIRFVDLTGDGDTKLVICNQDKKFRVFKGTSQLIEYPLLDIATAMCVIYMDSATSSSERVIPSIAVAAGCHIYIYRQLRPYKKWTNITNSLLNPQLAEITCMEVMKKYTDELNLITLLVIGTENDSILILPHDLKLFKILATISLPSTPVSLNILGSFDAEWRISVVCRNCKIYHIKNGDIRGTAVLSGTIHDAGSMPVSVILYEKYLWVATMDNSLCCYSFRGKKLRTIPILEDILEIIPIDVRSSKYYKFLMVVLIIGELRLYRDCVLVHTFRVNPPVNAVRFGRYGSHDDALIVIHGPVGYMTVKVWNKGVNLDSENFAFRTTGTPAEQVQ